jgi:hypothetical protein
MSLAADTNLPLWAVPLVIIAGFAFSLGLMALMAWLLRP